MTDDEKEWDKIVRSYCRPQLDDAVRMCKMRGVSSVTVLFETFEKLLADWFRIRDMTGTWE